jgi:hypothetical protein
MAKKEVLSYADGIRCNIEQHRFLDGASQPNARLTVSGGVATYGVDTYRGAELLPLSKKALYRAKGSGKNQIKSPSDEKRSFVRMDAECSGDLWNMSINQKSFVTKNISEGGILFQTEAPLSAGEILKLQVNLGSHQGPFHCRVRVIRVIELEEGGGFEVASEFVGLDASERLRLSTLIQEMFSDDHD